MLLIVPYACLRLLIDLALAPSATPPLSRPTAGSWPPTPTPTLPLATIAQRPAAGGRPPYPMCPACRSAPPELTGDFLRHRSSTSLPASLPIYLVCGAADTSSEPALHTEVRCPSANGDARFPTLVLGHKHGHAIAGHIVRIWPTPDPERCHASFNRGPDATSEPVTARAIPALLQTWDVEPVEWTPWAGPTHKRNPRP